MAGSIFGKDRRLLIKKVVGLMILFSTGAFLIGFFIGNSL